MTRRVIPRLGDSATFLEHQLVVDSEVLGLQVVLHEDSDGEGKATVTSLGYLVRRFGQHCSNTKTLLYDFAAFRRRDNNDV